MNNIRSDHGRAVRRPVSSAAAPCPTVAPVPHPAACSAARTETAPAPCAAVRETDDSAMPVMAYVPVQSFGRVYSECQALHSGTLFPALDKPFSGKGCCK